MKYEEIEVGDSYEYGLSVERVISKNDEYKAVMAVDEDGYVTAWDKNDLELFQPIKKELPESGLLVCDNGFIAYRLEGQKGFGFDKENHFENLGHFSFESYPDSWRTATPEEEAKFIKLLKTEAEKRGLSVDAKIKRHADGSSLYDPDYMGLTPEFNSTVAFNKNGQIFNKGIWAEPLTILDEVTEVIKKHLPNIIIEMVDGVVTLKQL